MDLGLAGKIAVVAAASRGLGKACALMLAREGCDLAICSRDQTAIERAGKEIADATGRRVVARACDLTNAESVKGFAGEIEKAYGAADILVNNCGGPKPGTFDALSDEDFRQASDLLVLSVVRLTKAMLPLMRKRRFGGRVITVTSVATREVIANLMLSNSLRSAVAGWSKTLARELAPEGILVNCVAPGTIGTERINELIAANAKASGKSADEVRMAMRGRVPLGRFGEPDEFAAAVTFLASARASFITGTTVYVDGGQSATII